MPELQTMIYQKYCGNENHVRLPEILDGRQVTGIGAKAFLSCKSVEKLELPPDIDTIGDWAFSHMKNLRELTLPMTSVCYGKQVFIGLDSLEKVFVHGMDCSGEDDLPEMIAMMIRYFEAPELLDFSELGSLAGRDAWIAKFDRAFLKFLDAENAEGYVPALIGWFDVEDLEDQRNRYKEERRILKAGLLITRLLMEKRRASAETDASVQLYERMGVFSEPLIDYLSGSSVKDEVAVYSIWKESGALTKDIVDRLLLLPDLTAEIRGFLVGLQMDSAGPGFFDSLDF